MLYFSGICDFSLKVVTENGTLENVDFERLLFWFVVPPPGYSRPFFELLTPANGDLGSFPSTGVPSIPITISVTADPSFTWALRYFGVDGPDDFIEVSLGVNTVYFQPMDLSPGQHTVGMFLMGAPDKNEDHYTVSDFVTVRYTITDSISGTLTIAYAGTHPLAPPSGGSTVSVPLTINISGFRGTGPLELQYSLTSPSNWNVYLDVVATGTAIYHFPRLAFSAEGGTLYLRISREFLTPGTVSIPYFNNTAPTIAIVSPTTSLEIFENPLNSSETIEINLNIDDSDPGDNLTLRYRIDDGSISELTAVNRGTSIRIEFPDRNLLKTPGSHTLFFEVWDGIDLSNPVSLNYSIVTAPILAVVNPAASNLGRITTGSSHTISLNVTGESNVTIQYQLENSSDWVDIESTKSEDILFVTFLAEWLTGTAALDGPHAVLFRVRGES
jgi:hypothetical protein